LASKRISGKPTARLRAEALAWLTADDDGPFSLRHCCLHAYSWRREASGARNNDQPVRTPARRSYLWLTATISSASVCDIIPTRFRAAFVVPALMPRPYLGGRAGTNSLTIRF
jgi:hypothetical protein